MKQYLIIFSLLSLAIVSCKKDYTCTCVQTSTTTAYTQYGVYHPQSITASTFRNTFKAKKDEAESICNNWESTTINSYGSGESHRTMSTIVSCEH